MSRTLGAGSASEPDRQTAAGDRAGDLPSGLVSLIVHFAALILLGLLTIEPSASGLAEISLHLQDLGDAELLGGELEAPIELDSEPDAAATELAAELPAMIAEVEPWPTMDALEAPLPELSDPLAEVTAVGRIGLSESGGSSRGAGRLLGVRTGPSSMTSMFGLVDEGARIAYVFDRSESMNSVFTLTSGEQSMSITPLEAAKAELMKSLNDLSEGAEFGLIFYNDEPVAFPDPLAEDGVSRATPQTKALAQSFIYGMVAERNTHHVPALQMATLIKPDVIFLLTDGEAKDDPSSAQVRQLEKLCRRTGTRINVIHFCVEPRSTTTLRGLAHKTGGQFKTVTFRSLLEPDWKQAAIAE